MNYKIMNHKSLQAGLLLVRRRRSRAKLILVIFLIGGIISCHKKDNVVESNFVKHWDRLTIDSEKQKIVIDNDLDYGRRYYWDIEEIDTDNGHIEYNTVNYKEEKFSITKQEQDSLYTYIHDIVTNPVYTNQLATDNVGRISISFTIGTITLSCSYVSVGNWTTISPQLKKIYLLLKNKTEILEE
jgi:hypothetical protein